MAQRKAGGSTKLGRDSIAKRLGVKVYGSQRAEAGNVLVRQRGTKIHPGLNVRRGSDDTLYANVAGIVRFVDKKVKDFTGKITSRKFVDIVMETKK